MVDIVGSDKIPYSFHMDKKVQRHLDKIKQKITKSDKDYLLVVDGAEGSGKSTFASTIAKYVDNDFCLDRMCFTAEEFKQAILKGKKGEVICYDESVTGLSASESISRVGKMLKVLMMVMRQKNLCVVIVIPSIFDLSKYVALHRSQTLYHIVEKKGRYSFWGYSKSDLRKLYLRGKQTYSYLVKSRFSGRFFKTMGIEREPYIAKKMKCLEDMDKEDTREKKEIIQRDYLLYLLKGHLKTGAKVGKAMQGCKYPLSQSTIRGILQEQAEMEVKITDGVHKR